jgi:dihydroorotate dehydrogenase (fumarate)
MWKTIPLVLPYGTVYNAAGCRCTTSQDLDALNSCQSGAMITKSCTLEARKGNPHPKYHDDGDNSINSNGLENMGYSFYLAWFRENKPTKPFILSVAGLSVEDNIIIINEAVKAGVHAIELNLSCPNLGGVAISQDPAALKDTLEIIRTECNDITIPFGLKLPIYTKKTDISAVALLVKQLGISFVTCSNSLPNCIIYQTGADGTPIESIANTTGGGGGRMMKPVVLGQIYQFRKLLDEAVSIVACGGIASEQDCLEALRAGANYIQMGTRIMTHGLDALDLDLEI